MHEYKQGEEPAQIIDNPLDMIRFVARAACAEFSGSGFAVGHMVDECSGTDWVFLRFGKDCFAVSPDCAEGIATAFELGAISFQSTEFASSEEAAVLIVKHFRTMIAKVEQMRAASATRQ